MGWKEKAVTALWRWIRPLTTANRAKLLFPGCALSLPSTTKNSTLLKWRPFSVSRWRAKTSRYVGAVCQRACDAALSRLCDGFTPDVAGAGAISHVIALVELHRKRVANGERSVLVGLQSFAEGLDLKGALLSQVHIHKIAFPPSTVRW